MKKSCCVLLLLLITTQVGAQSQPLRKQRIIFSPGLGYDFRLNSIRSNNITDQLTSINASGFSLPQFSVKWFIAKNWGVEAYFQGLVFGRTKKSRGEIRQILEEKLGAQYYIQSPWPGYYDDDPITNGRISGAFGVNYKIEKGRLAMIPRFLVGVVTIGQRSESYRLKERNTNTMLDWRISDGYGGGKDVFLWGPGMSLVYRFDSFKGICLNSSWMMHRADIDYRETTTNLVTKETITQQLTNNNMMHRLNIGLGFTFSLGRKKELVQPWSQR